MAGTLGIRRSPQSSGSAESVKTGSFSATVSPAVDDAIGPVFGGLVFPSHESSSPTHASPHARCWQRWDGRRGCAARCGGLGFGPKLLPDFAVGVAVELPPHRVASEHIGKLLVSKFRTVPLCFARKPARRLGQQSNSRPG